MRQWQWLADVGQAQSRGPHDVRERYASVSFLSDKVVVFNVKGKHYRLEARIACATGVVQVIWVGTHGEYDERDRKR